jgi:DNA-binding NtrC family response regulator
VARPLETGIDGYVRDNMEGAVDQAIFLAGLDVPVAIIGARGTGKMYVAQIIHQQTGAAADMLEAIDCREFRSRNEAIRRIGKALTQSAGKTLVFKSPHLMHADAQLKLARQISTRTLADVSPPRYLPPSKLVALFPDNLEYLVRHSGLTEKLASVFAAYPIHVPPIRDRKQAVLRWAHKILGQECARRDRSIRGFTRDAEQALLLHDWPGNISEMRQLIVGALERTDKAWITPVDLGLFKGISPDGAEAVPESQPFLAVVEADSNAEQDYAPSALEQLDVALGEAVNALMTQELIKPLGSWLDDDVVLAACDRYRGELRHAAEFLHTKSRNISRWMPKIMAREAQRNASSLWQEPQGLVRAWIRESGQLSQSPLEIAQNLLMSHVAKQCDNVSVAQRAQIMGVSTPTYHKRLQEALEHQARAGDSA